MLQFVADHHATLEQIRCGDFNIETKRLWRGFIEAGLGERNEATYVGHARNHLKPCLLSGALALPQTRRAVPNFATIKKGVQGVTKRSLSYREVEQLAQVAPQLVQLTPGVDRAKTLVEVAAAEGVRTDEAGAAAAAQRKQRLHDALLRVARGHYAEFLTGGGFGRPEEAAAAAAWEHGFDPDRHVPDIAIKRRQWNAAAPGGGGGYNPGSAGGSSSSGSDGPTPSAARRPSPLRTPAMERPRTNTSDDGSVPSDAELLERVRRRAQEQARQQLDVVKNSENMLVADLPKLAETIHLHYRRKKRTRIYTDDLVAALLSGQQQHKKTLNEATVVQQLQLLRRVCANWISPVELQGRELLQVNKSVEFKEVQQHLRLVVQEARRREIARRAEAAQAAAEAAAQ